MNDDINGIEDDINGIDYDINGIDDDMLSLDSTLIKDLDYDDEVGELKPKQEPYDSDAQLKCGDILLTSSRSISLCCGYCERKYHGVETFLRHILKHLMLSKEESCSEESLPVPDIEPRTEKHVKTEYEGSNLILLQVSRSAEANDFATNRIPQDDFMNQFEQYINASDDNDKSLKHVDDVNNLNLSGQDYEEYELLDESSEDWNRNNTEIESDEVKYEIEFLQETTCNQNADSNFQEIPLRANLPTRSSVKLNKFSCKRCLKVFKSNDQLCVHMKRHSMDKPYGCEYCEAHFTDRSNLKVHTKRHLGIKPHCCALCDKSFTSSTELKLHTRSHTGERPYVCEECGQKFTTSGHLKSHRRRHYNERPYECENCGKDFYDRKLLRDHEATHSSERPFACDVCNTTFKRQKALAEHKKLHSGVKNYSCKICKKSFAQNAGLWSHVKQHHASEPTYLL